MSDSYETIRIEAPRDLRVERLAEALARIAVAAVDDNELLMWYDLDDFVEAFHVELIRLIDPML